MGNVNEIPMYYFSPEIQGLIKHFSEVMQSPTNYVATSILTAVGAVAGKRLTIEDGAYINFGQLYACLVGVPGAAKSPAMDIVMQPINEIDYGYYRSYKQEIKEWKISDGKTDKPTLRKIACDDVTAEKLFSILSENENGVILHCDELTDFTRNLNRYNNGDNMPKFLKIWGNGNIRVDRKGDDPLMIPKPFLSILSSTQPVNLAKVFAPHTGTGLFPRWIFCLPNDKPEERADPNPKYSEYWKKIVVRLTELPEIRLDFSTEAKEVLNTFDEMIQMETDYNSRQERFEFSEYLMKQRFTIRRLAGIVHLICCETDIMKGEVSPTISKEEVDFAEELVDFYKGCAKEVLSVIDKSRRFPLTSKELIKAMFDRFQIDNVSEFSRSIGISHQYVSRIRNE